VSSYEEHLWKFSKKKNSMKEVIVMTILWPTYASIRTHRSWFYDTCTGQSAPKVLRRKSKYVQFT